MAGKLVAISALSSCGVIVALIVSAMAPGKMRQTVMEPLRVAFPLEWGTLSPGQQHTAYADVILRNEFEPLISVKRRGGFEPLAASQWTLSPDQKVLTFTIDTKRRFSDGTYLSSTHFKAAWEATLKEVPKSSNRSTEDVLYNVVGFDEFESTGGLRGLETPSADTFVVRMNRPMRTALQFLSGSRYAAFIMRSGRAIGTAKYVINELPDHSLRLVRNPFHQDQGGFPIISIVRLPKDKATEALEKGEIDLYAFAQAAAIPQCGQGPSKNIDCVTGDETTHLVVSANALPGRLFENADYRRAFQYLLVSNIKSASEDARLRLNPVRLDPQVFLPFQAGRLPEEEVRELIKKGQRGLDALKLASIETPVFYATDSNDDWILKVMRDNGIRVSPKSGEYSFKERLEILYKSGAADLVRGSMSVVSGDPDGLYHALGKHGAIASPMEFRPEVAELFESGRALVDYAALTPHYQNAARRILADVPFVHIGFEMDLMAYRSDRLRLRESVKDRNELRFELFEPR